MGYDHTKRPGRVLKAVPATEYEKRIFASLSEASQHIHAAAIIACEAMDPNRVYELVTLERSLLAKCRWRMTEEV